MLKKIKYGKKKKKENAETLGKWYSKSGFRGESNNTNYTEDIKMQMNTFSNFYVLVNQELD